MTEHRQQTVEEAIERLEDALLRSQHLPFSENPQRASQMIELADLYREKGDLDTTLSLYKKALRNIQEEAPDTIGLYRIAHEIGTLHDAAGETEQAREYYEKALHLSGDGHGGDACEVATIYNNLALSYRHLGELALAEGHYHRALEIYERVRGVDHPDVASMLNNLGALYIAQNDLEMAEAMHLRALNLRQKAFGENHPDVAQSFGNLAVVHHARQNWKKAGGYYRDALDVLARQSRTDWDEYSIVLENYADFLKQTGKAKKADELLAELSVRRGGVES